MRISLKYGLENVEISLDDSIDVSMISPNYFKTTHLNEIKIDYSPLYETIISKNKKPNSLRVGIAINDKTRPVPYPKLIPNLIAQLLDFGINPKNINFFIFNGTHVPYYDLSYLNLPSSISTEFTFYQHESKNDNNLQHLGVTTYNNPNLY